MPNWCYNGLTLANEDKSKIDALEEHLKKATDPEQEDANGFLDFLIPNPSGDWDYGWSVENWGCKWDPHPEDWGRDDDNTLYINFDSAWSPPTIAYDKLVEQGWDVNAYYHEPGMAFAGHYEDGHDDDYSYDFEDENWKDDIPEDVIDFAGLEYEYENWQEWQEDEKEVD